jgi:hypothetical protein
MRVLQRAVLGFIAASLSVLLFHQGMVGVLYLSGLVAQPPYDLSPVGPLEVPLLVSQCFWGGLYGALFGIVLPSLRGLPSWLPGFGLGLLSVLVGWFVVAPLNGLPVASDWDTAVMLRSVLINGSWGIGVGLIAPALMPRRRRAHRTFG